MQDKDKEKMEKTKQKVHPCLTNCPMHEGGIEEEIRNQGLFEPPLTPKASFPLPRKICRL